MQQARQIGRHVRLAAGHGVANDCLLARQRKVGRDVGDRGDAERVEPVRLHRGQTRHEKDPVGRLIGGAAVPELARIRIAAPLARFGVRKRFAAQAITQGGQTAWHLAHPIGQAIGYVRPGKECRPIDLARPAHIGRVDMQHLDGTKQHPRRFEDMGLELAWGIWTGG